MPVKAIKIFIILLITATAASKRDRFSLSQNDVSPLRQHRLRSFRAQNHNDALKFQRPSDFVSGFQENSMPPMPMRAYMRALRDKYHKRMLNSDHIRPWKNHSIRDIEDTSPCEGELKKCYHDHSPEPDSESATEEGISEEPNPEKPETEEPEAETEPTETQEESISESNTQKTDLTLELQHALPLLEKISAEISQKKAEASNHLRNDFQCEIDGLWTSNVGGVRLRLTTHEDGRIGVVVNATDAPHLGNLQDCAWHLSGLVPSKRQGPFAMAAVCSRQHRIAVFLGQCKVCEDSETIFGNWMFSRLARDCSDAMMALETKSDVWRRDHSEDAKHMHHGHTGAGDVGQIDNTTCVTPLLPIDD